MFENLFLRRFWDEQKRRYNSKLVVAYAGEDWCRERGIIPDAPVTSEQLDAILNLARERGDFVDV